MEFFFGLVRFVKLALAIAVFLLFLRALFFPNFLDMIVLLLLSFVLFMMLISRP